MAVLTEVLSGGTRYIILPGRFATGLHVTSGVIMQALSWSDTHVQAAERKAITMNMTLNEELESADAEHRPVSCKFVVDEVSRILSRHLHCRSCQAHELSGRLL